MKKVKVVTSFLMYENKILILRRSDKVLTMKHKWAGISGYIEYNERILKRAYKEINEETGLSSNEIEIIKTSEQLEIIDEELDTLWIIYPHLFKTTRTNVKLDWEHDQYQWIEPTEITNYEGVPMLRETLQNVLK
ncbi:MAG: NUDIX hydrolase [Thaumarchaeota archaeon]|nr:NUDIX hydrolase [Nitrososphaerota archaeon]|tara:strand:- start:1760 stop:2164 length:405 start_codon:yes stop_codon:yes gene_type:complete